MSVYLLVGVPLSAIVKTKESVSEDGTIYTIKREFYVLGRKVDTRESENFDMFLRQHLPIGLWAHSCDRYRCYSPRRSVWAQAIQHYVAGVAVKDGSGKILTTDGGYSPLEIPYDKVQATFQEAEAIFAKIGCAVNPSLFVIDDGDYDHWGEEDVYASPGVAKQEKSDLFQAAE